MVGEVGIGWRCYFVNPHEKMAARSQIGTPNLQAKQKHQSTSYSEGKHRAYRAASLKVPDTKAHTVPIRRNVPTAYQHGKKEVEYGVYGIYWHR